MRVLMLPIAAVLIACIAVSPVRLGADEGGSTNDDLLERLLGDPIDEEAERDVFGPGPGGEQPGGEPDGPPQKGQDDQDPSLEQVLGPAGVPEEANPMLDIGRKMRMVEGRIRGHDSGTQTQSMQGEIVASLDELIAAARQKCKKCQGGQSRPQGVASRKPVRQPKQPKPGSGEGRRSEGPVSNPNATAGTSEGRRPDMEVMLGVLEELWEGQLPPKAREQMLDLPIEEFLPKYELLIEEYFKQLAEEQETPR
jgi:hypothetical protein